MKIARALRTLVERAKVVSRSPFRFQPVHFFAGQAARLRVGEHLCQRETLRRRPKHEFVICHVDRAAEQTCRFGVSARNQQHGAFQQVELEAGGDEPGDMGRSRNQDFAGEMTALMRISETVGVEEDQAYLLASVKLIFHMNSRCTL